MNQRQDLQLKLQSTVEGLSVAAITYYFVGLVSYLAKGAQTLGWPWSPESTAAVAIPLVAGSVWWSLRRLTSVCSRTGIEAWRTRPRAVCQCRFHVCPLEWACAPPAATAKGRPACVRAAGRAWKDWHGVRVVAGGPARHRYKLRVVGAGGVEHEEPFCATWCLDQLGPLRRQHRAL